MCTNNCAYIKTNYKDEGQLRTFSHPHFRTEPRGGEGLLGRHFRVKKLLQGFFITFPWSHWGEKIHDPSQKTGRREVVGTHFLIKLNSAPEWHYAMPFAYEWVAPGTFLVSAGVSRKGAFDGHLFEVNKILFFLPSQSWLVIYNDIYFNLDFVWWGYNPFVLTEGMIRWLWIGFSRQKRVLWHIFWCHSPSFGRRGEFFSDLGIVFGWWERGSGFDPRWAGGVSGVWLPDPVLVGALCGPSYQHAFSPGRLNAGRGLDST